MDFAATKDTEELEARKNAVLCNMDICRDDGRLPASKAHVTDDEVQRLFIMFDHDYKGYFTCEDAERIIQGAEDTSITGDALYELITKDKDMEKVTFIHFREFLEQAAKACGDVSVQERIFLLMSESGSCQSARVVTIGVMLVILASTLSFIMETSPGFQVQSCHECKPEPMPGFAKFEMACILLFTAEYSTRVLMSPFVTFDYEKLKMSMNYSDMKRIGGEQRFVWGRLLRYIVVPMNLVDFFAIMPFYLELLMGTGGGFSFLRVLRLARVFRIFKMGKYSSGAKLLGRTLVKSFPALQLLVFFSMIGLTLFSSIIYFVELGDWKVTEDYPGGAFFHETPEGVGDQLSAFTSIPRCFWFVLVTATTVGYGDMSPTSQLGKTVASALMIAGLLVLALPITVFGSNFAQEYARLQEETEREAVEHETRMVHKHALFANSVYGDEFERQSKELESQPKVSSSNRYAFRRSSSMKNSSSASEERNPVPEREGKEGWDGGSPVSGGSDRGGCTESRPASNRSEANAWTGGAHNAGNLCTSTLKRMRNSKETLAWVAVMQQYHKIAKIVREYRDHSKIKPSVCDTLLEEAQQMVLLLSKKGTHTESLMPSMNIVVGLVTRAYQDDTSCLDQRKGQEIISAFFTYAALIATSITPTNTLSSSSSVSLTHAIKEATDVLRAEHRLSRLSESNESQLSDGQVAFQEVFEEKSQEGPRGGQET